MTDYITTAHPFIEFFTRLARDPQTVSFLALILVVFVAFFLKTRATYATIEARLSGLRADLAKVFGTDDPSEYRIIRAKDAREALRNETILKAFCANGFEEAGLHIDRCMGSFVDQPRLLGSADSIQRYFSSAALEKAFVSPATMSRSSFLTALGALGTFLGLVVGVGAASTGLASTTGSEAVEAISKLLGGSELAFTTSLLGLSLALAHSVYLNHRRRRHGVVSAKMQNYLMVALHAQEQAGIISARLTTTSSKIAREIERHAEHQLSELRSLNGAQSKAQASAMDFRKGLDESVTNANGSLAQIRDQICAQDTGRRPGHPAGSLSPEVTNVLKRINMTLENMGRDDRAANQMLGSLIHVLSNVEDALRAVKTDTAA